MGRRSVVNDYTEPGMYHITIQAAEGQPFGRVVGDVSKADGDPAAPHVELSAVGEMVQEELLNSIRRYYRMIEVQDYVVMPEHLHFILEVHETIVSMQGHRVPLGTVIAGFKKGCNRRYWAMTGQDAPQIWRGEPADADNGEGMKREPAGADGDEERGKAADADGIRGAASSRAVVSPQRKKVPSRASTGRQPLFAEGYVDVMPLKEGQLRTQREYIRNNPRIRLMRSQNRQWLQTRRGGIDTALTVNALMGYLDRECGRLFTPEAAAGIREHLMMENGQIGCDSYGNRELLKRTLLPVVCHQKDRYRFAEQREKCLEVVRAGAVLVSARISPKEQEIMDAAMSEGMPVVLIADNGFPERYHPSAERLRLCSEGRLLIVTPWRYRYRPAGESITVMECKAMNCMAQALCRKKDGWWKDGER